MPRFFFHLHDGKQLNIDAEGVVLPSFEDAITEANRAAREILAERVYLGEVIDGEEFIICGGDGARLTTVPFKSVLRIH